MTPEKLIEMAFWADESVKEHFSRMVQRIFDLEVKEYEEMKARVDAGYYEDSSELDALNSEDREQAATPEEIQAFDEALERSLEASVRMAKANNLPLYGF